MSDKELLYIKDALSHQKLMETKLQTSLSSITDPGLKEVANTLYTRSKNITSSLLSLLGGKQ